MTPLPAMIAARLSAGAMKLNGCGSPTGPKLFTPITLPLSSMVGPPLMPSVTAASISYSGLDSMVDFLLTLPLLFVGSSDGR